MLAAQQGGAMVARVGINGFGRIGRCVLRAGLDDAEIEFVAVNDITDAKTLAHLLKYDSTHGTLRQPVEVRGDGLQIGSRHVKVLAEREPANLPWGDLGCDVIIESTGLFTKREAAARHLAGGAR
jgi:glyceraldehyde 3-phosphate dehydrogenase